MMWSNPMTIYEQVYLPGPKRTRNKTRIPAVADKQRAKALQLEANMNAIKTAEMTIYINN